MTNIEIYNEKKYESDYCRSWARLIGSRYAGGGGGVGALRSLHLAQGEGLPTVYHQDSDGALNYHLMPKSLVPHLEKAIKENFTTLIARALELQETELREVAGKAVEEHSKLLQAANLMPVDCSTT